MKTQFILSFAVGLWALVGCHSSKQNGGDLGEANDAVPCSSYGAPPFNTVYPVTKSLNCEDGTLLSWEQDTVTRYACLNYPAQADSADYQWPLLIYLHGSLTTPESMYREGRALFELRDTYPLSDDEAVRGFAILSPEGRRAIPYEGQGKETGKGFHWDEWYRNPSENLDALAIDHFLDGVIAMGKVDTSRIYAYGWSNGAFMTVLYSTWRSSRIAQYAGANPWTRTPCAIDMSYDRQVPLFLMRNLCDYLVTCDSTNAWVDTLAGRDWPFRYVSLDMKRDTVANTTACTGNCGKVKGIENHVRWPQPSVFEAMLGFLKGYDLD